MMTFEVPFNNRKMDSILSMLMFGFRLQWNVVKVRSECTRPNEKIRINLPVTCRIDFQG